MNELAEILGSVFGAEGVPGDSTGCLSAIGGLLAFCEPSLLFIADHLGEVRVADDLGSAVGLDESKPLAAALCAPPAFDDVRVCRTASGPSRTGFAVRFPIGDNVGILGGATARVGGWKGRISALAPALRACGQVAWLAIQREQEVRMLRIRLKQMLMEQQMLKSSHTEATVQAVEEQARRVREEHERQAMEKVCEATQAASRAKSQFLANMSHEIRTPLNAILGFTDLLLKGMHRGDEAETREYLETIYSSGNHLLELINDILDLSKIEAGHMRVEKVCCSPQAIVADAMSVLRARAAEKGLSFQAEWPDGLPATIHTDPTRLRQLLVNLLGNAVKFTESGGVRVVARLSPPGPNRRLAFEIIDTGIGIAPDKLESIFDAFVQADNSVTRRFGGTGLGLAISRRIAAALDGELRVRSQVGAGSTFTATIDPGALEGVAILPAPPDDALASAGAYAAATLPTLPPCRILVVEDGSANRKLFRLVLTKAGADVTVAENGQIGVDLANRQAFDLILMDMQMPVLDGYSATRALRQRGTQVPIIALTAHAMSGDEQKCREAGCSAYLSKPVNSDLLLRTVVACLEHGGTPPAAQQNAVAPEEAAGSPAQTAQRDSPSGGPLTSSLPTDDPDFREIVVEFIETLHEDLEKMRQAWAERDLPTLARLVHGLKGSGGAAGFDVLTEAAKRLETLVKQQRIDQIPESLDGIGRLAAQVVIPETSPA